MNQKEDCGGRKRDNKNNFKTRENDRSVRLRMRQTKIMNKNKKTGERKEKEEKGRRLKCLEDFGPFQNRVKD